MNPSGQKVDIIQGLDDSDHLFVEGAESSGFSFGQVNNFSAPTGHFSGVGILLVAFLKGFISVVI